MAVIKSVPIKVDIPHEPGEWMELRPLSWSQLRDARKKQDTANREEMKALGAEFIKAMQSGSAVEADRVEQVMAARAEVAAWKVDAFDRETVLRIGVARWSYAEDLGPEALLALDELTAQWAAEAIIARSKPRTRDAEKNDNVASIAS